MAKGGCTNDETRQTSCQTKTQNVYCPLPKGEQTPSGQVEGQRQRQLLMQCANCSRVISFFDASGVSSP